MNKNMLQKLVAMLMLLVMLSGVACAETTEELYIDPCNMPERGLVFPFTDADLNELHMGASYFVGSMPDVYELPALEINFTDMEGMEKALSVYTEEQMEDPDLMWEIFSAAMAYNHTLYSMALIEKEYYDAQIAAGKSPAEMLGFESVDVIGENDGYVYVGVNNYEEVLSVTENANQKALGEKAVARCKEIVAALTFQPIVFAEGEFTEMPVGALTFSTQDLSGNAVTQELFMGKKLTVLNVWGTFCTPCIEEMPELAEWSQNMPEGVQLVGLVSDLNRYDDAEILGMAQYICEATGAGVYTHLVANSDFNGLLAGVVGVPTTFFIDESGMFVGEPVVGANVPACKSFVESYMAE